jgi:hypothetical protein
MCRRANPDEETTDWRAVCGKTASTVRRAGRARALSDPYSYSAWTRTDNQSSFLVPVQETFLDPVFWHAFGRALGWDAPCELAIMCVHGDTDCQRCHSAYWMYH